MPYPGATQSRLPCGSHPPALSFDHFPNRLLTFVWRNWNLISAGKMASLLHCEAWQVSDIAQAMGLEEKKALFPAYSRQLYISLLRRIKLLTVSTKNIS